MVHPQIQSIALLSGLYEITRMILDFSLHVLSATIRRAIQLVKLVFITYIWNLLPNTQLNAMKPSFVINPTIMAVADPNHSLKYVSDKPSNEYFNYIHIQNQTFHQN